jgi:putative flippase GtrA
MTVKRQTSDWWAKLALHVPPEQFGRYLLVGLANTIVGYGTFALFTAILDRFTAHGYVLASVLSGLLNITFAYLNYKRFVFRTKGNYLREWSRCLAVYGSAIVIGAMLLPIFVFFLHRWAGLTVSAPYLAGLVLLALTTIYNFLGNKKFSFRSPA